MRQTFSPEMQPEPAAIRDAAEMFDRMDIEAEALVLIAEHEALPSVETPQQEWDDNARTAIFEGLTASGHLSRIEITGSPEEIDRQVLDRLLKGYLSCTDPHERDRRFAELCNRLIIQKILRLVALGELDESTAVAEISDYTFGLSDKRARSLGYRPFNHKGMVRSTHLRRNADGSFTQIIEQMSRSNSTPESAQGFLGDAGIYVSEEMPVDIAILSKPVVYKTTYDYADGVIAIQRRLDAYAGPNVQYGEEIGANPLHVSYEKVREESGRREKEVEFYVERLSKFEKRLAAAEEAGLITSEQRHGQYGEELRRILRSICLLAPEYAEDCFGAEAAPYYYRASDFVAMGDYGRAEAELEEAKPREQPIVKCGGEIPAETAKKFGIQPDSVRALTSMAKKSWKKLHGICRIKNCPSKKPRPRSVELGPCRVCMGSCQPIFERHRNPEAEYARAEREERHQKVAAEAERTDRQAEAASKVEAAFADSEESAKDRMKVPRAVGGTALALAA